jgi:DNA sulfur modification protein DndB
MTINSHTFDAVRGRQAASDFYIAMCSLKSVAKLFTFKDADIPAEQRAQRTLRKSRIPRIRDYVLQNSEDYTFSSVTVSVDGKITFNPISKSNVDLGTISISQDAAILINDGQHRVAAIKEAIEENPDLGRDKISVVFFEDLKLEKSQQMFADLNKHAVKPTKSLGILYDRRNDFAAFVVEMIKVIKVFYNTTEMEKTSISNRSTKLFTLSGLELATKNLLGKDKNLTENKKRTVIDFWNAVAKNIPEWVLLIDKKVTPSEIRKDFVHANTNMLEAIAIAGNQLIEKHPNKWKQKLVGLQKIDWSRKNPEWDDKIIIRGKMTKTKAGMNSAAKILLKYCEKT